jgi:hypothetical protein
MEVPQRPDSITITKGELATKGTTTGGVAAVRKTAFRLRRERFRIVSRERTATAISSNGPGLSDDRGWQSGDGIIG